MSRFIRLLKPLYPLLVVLGIVLLLRLPSLFEPYWYGDEGIYLALGQAMRRGAVLYRDIWDNKPPLLYMIYAIIPTLLWAKITATVFVLGTTAVVYKISRNFLAALLAGVLLSIPLLEGTIANAELYFTLPIALAAYFFLINRLKPGFIGILLAIAFLLKVPAAFDFLGMFAAYLLIDFIEVHPRNGRAFFSFILKQVKFFLAVALIPLLSLVILTVYFQLHHALPDFLLAVFFQNASYVTVDSGPLSKLSNPLFIKGLLLLFSLLILLVLFLKKRVSKEFLFLSFWFGFSLYGALLSNRPYLHYLLQIVPPGVILLFYMLRNIRQYLILNTLYLILLLLLARMFTGAFALDTRSYYANWFDYLSERKSWMDYVNYFDSRTSNNYDLAKYIDQNTGPNDPIFFWGDNAFVYVVSNRPAATKFIQAHHLTTIPPKNYDLIMQRLEKYQPKLILVSRPAGFAFPTLEDFLKKNYRPTQTFESVYVYRSILPANPPTFNPQYTN
ncbi:hypothetical protein M1403_02365 [Patescibacteria group bacterium]|nr:hypothetical protein [Patescibacteria group bacterium]